MNLKHLTDKTLLIDIKNLIHKERDCLTQILHHLKEIDRRRLYSDLKYPSLFEYCVKELGYSDASAFRRIQACRLLAVIPEIEPKIETGTLSLMNLSRASQFFNQNKISDPVGKKEVLSQLENLSQREGEKKLFEISGTEKKQQDSKRRVSANEFRLTLILSEEVMNKFLEFKGLSHRHMKDSEFFEKALDISIQHLKKKKFKIP